MKIFYEGDILESRIDEVATHLVIKTFLSLHELEAFLQEGKLSFGNLEQFRAQMKLPVYLIKDLVNPKLFLIASSSSEYFYQMDIIQ